MAQRATSMTVAVALRRPRMTHELKCWPGNFEATVRGDKHHEIRVNDRDFQVGDLVILREFTRLRSRHTGARRDPAQAHGRHRPDAGGRQDDGARGADRPRRPPAVTFVTKRGEGSFTGRPAHRALLPRASRLAVRRVDPRGQPRREAEVRAGLDHPRQQGRPHARRRAAQRPEGDEEGQGA
jgi:hypothetical protein